MSKVLIKEMREAVLCASNTSQAYNIPSNLIAIEKIGEVFKIHLRNLTPISELTKSLILNQANAVGAY
ncbi:MAG: hypothetical protein NWP91_04775, partial [Rickettsiaceae bacterium]|nr:hypothetical protein [Rickettsiaceae bacterium]